MEDALRVGPNNVWSAANNTFLRGEGALLAIGVTVIVKDPTGVREHGICSGHVLLIDVLEARTLTNTDVVLVPLPSESSVQASGEGGRISKR